MNTFDAMVQYKSRRGEQVDYKLDSVLKSLDNLKPEEVFYDPSTKAGYYENNPSPSYALYNLQMVLLEEVIACQRRMEEFILRKRRKDSNFNVTFKRNGVVIECLLI